MRRIRRIGVMSAATMYAAIGAAVGLIVGAFISLFAVMGSSMAGDSDLGPAGLLLGVGAIIMLPLAYAVFSFISGAIAAVVYNAAARVTGGVAIELEDAGTTTPGF